MKRTIRRLIAAGTLDPLAWLITRLADRGTFVARDDKPF